MQACDTAPAQLEARLLYISRDATLQTLAVPSTADWTHDQHFRCCRAAFAFGPALAELEPPHRVYRRRGCGVISTLPTLVLHGWNVQQTA